MHIRDQMTQMRVPADSFTGAKVYPFFLALYSFGDIPMILQKRREK